MAKTTNNILLFAGLGLGAYLLYRKYASGQSPAPSVPSVNAPQVDPVTEYPPVSAMSVSPPVQSGQVSPIDSGGGIVIPNGIDPVVYGTVLNWLQEDADPKMSVMAVNPIPSEFQGLYNIIANNLWGNASVEQFWNTLYAKYH